MSILNPQDCKNHHGFVKVKYVPLKKPFFMKRITITLCSLCIILFSCNDSRTPDDSTSISDSTKTGTDTSTATAPLMDSAAMMQAWQAYMTPGSVHAMLAKSNGTWEGDVTMWMEPGKPPIKSKATTVNKMIFIVLFN